jgi:hypothetical protein
LYRNVERFAICPEHANMPHRPFLDVQVLTLVSTLHKVKVEIVFSRTCQIATQCGMLGCRELANVLYRPCLDMQLLNHDGRQRIYLP